MGRLKDVLVGTRAIKRVPLPLVNVPSSASPDQPELSAQRQADREAWQADAPPGSDPGAFDVSTVEVGLRVLTGAEHSLVLQKAVQFAKDRGGTGEFTDPQHGLGMQVYTLAIACVDPDSDPRDPVPFFGEPGAEQIESAVREILASPMLGRDGIVYLHEAQELWQDMCSPQSHRVSTERFVEIMRQAATDGDARGFLALRPGTRWDCFRSISVLHVSSLTHKLPSGVPSQESSSSSSSGRDSAP